MVYLDIGSEPVYWLAGELGNWATYNSPHFFRVCPQLLGKLRKSGVRSGQKLPSCPLSGQRGIYQGLPTFASIPMIRPHSTSTGVPGLLPGDAVSVLEHDQRGPLCFFCQRFHRSLLSTQATKGTAPSSPLSMFCQHVGFSFAPLFYTVEIWSSGLSTVPLSESRCPLTLKRCGAGALCLCWF